MFVLVGESIAISAEFENYSSRTVIPYATLHQTQMFFANGKTRIRDTKFTVLTGEYNDSLTNRHFSPFLFDVSEVSNVGRSVVHSAQCILTRLNYF